MPPCPDQALRSSVSFGTPPPYATSSPTITYGKVFYLYKLKKYFKARPTVMGVQAETATMIHQHIAHKHQADALAG